MKKSDLVRTVYGLSSERLEHVKRTESAIVFWIPVGDRKLNRGAVRRRQRHIKRE